MPAREVNLRLGGRRQTIDGQDNHILPRIVNSEAHPSMAVWDDVVGDTEAFLWTPLVSYLAPELRDAGGVAW